jgi:hypothetical protein
MNPQFEDESPMNPFDLWEGANFKLKIRTVEGYRNYDKSEFDKRGPLFSDDAKMEAIWKSEHLLQPFLAPSNFKSYEELEARLNKVLGLDGGSAAPAAARQAAAARKPTVSEEDAPWMDPKPQPTRQATNNVADEDEIRTLSFSRGWRINY